MGQCCLKPDNSRTIRYQMAAEHDGSDRAEACFFTCFPFPTLIALLHWFRATRKVAQCSDMQVRTARRKSLVLVDTSYPRWALNQGALFLLQASLFV